MGRLQARSLSRLRPEDGRDRQDFPDGANGLVYRASASGRGVFICRYRTPDGTRRSLRIGPAEAVTLGQARDRAREIMGRVAGGADPAAEQKQAADIARREKAQGPRPARVSELSEAYFQAAADGRHNARGRPKRASTLALERGQWKRIEPLVGDRTFAELTRGDVRAVIDALLADGLSNATVNGHGALLRAILAYGVHTEQLQTNVAQGVATALAAPSRDRVLNEGELAAFWRAFRAPAEHGMENVTGLALAFATVTLQRAGEVAGLPMAELDRTNARWTIAAERAKGRTAHSVPLSPLALQILDEAEAMYGSGPFVFPGRGRGARPIRRDALTRAMARLRDRLGLAHATPHDLRRTGATVLAAHGFADPFTISKVLGHASDTGGAAAVTSVYAKYSYDREKRDALQKWADHVAQLDVGDGPHGALVT